MRVAHVHCGGKAHATTHGLRLHAADHEAGHRADRIDHQGEAVEEGQAGRLIIDRHQLIKAGTGAEGFFALAPKYDHADAFLSTGLLDVLRQCGKDVGGQAVALGVKKSDGGNAVGDRGLHKGFVHGMQLLAVAKIVFLRLWW